MNKVDQLAAEIENRFSINHPILAPQFPFYLLLSTLQMYDGLSIDGAPLTTFACEAFTRDAHLAVRDDDSFNEFIYEADGDFILKLVRRCSQYAISQFGQLQEPYERRVHLKAYRRALGWSGLDSEASQSESKPGRTRVKKDLLGAARAIFADDSGALSSKASYLYGVAPSGAADFWLDKSEEDAYTLLRHSIVLSYMFSPEFFLRLAREGDRRDPLRDRIVSLAKPKEGCQVFGLVGGADLLVGIDKEYPGRIRRAAGLDLDDSSLLNLAVAFANDMRCYFDTDTDPLGEMDSDLGEVNFDFLDPAEPDLIVGVLPVKLATYPDELPLRFVHGRKSSKRDLSDIAFTEHLLTLLGDSGRAILAVSDRFLNSSNGRGLREYITENDLLETVWAMPSTEVRSGGINRAIIVLSKAKTHPREVVFDGDGELYRTAKVTIDEILSHGSDWRPSRYAHRDRVEVHRLLEGLPDRGCSLADCVEDRVAGLFVKQKSIVWEPGSDRSKVETIPYVRVCDLSKGSTYDDFNASKDIRFVPRGEAQAIIDFPSILVSTIGADLRATLFECANTAVAIGKDVVALRLKSDINPSHLLTQLNSRLVRIQVEMVSSGNLLRRISVDDLLSLRLPFSPLNERDLDALETFSAELGEVRRDAQGADRESEERNYNIVAAISHNLSQKLGSIGNDLVTMSLFLEKKKCSGERTIFSELVRSVQPGEPIDRVPTLKDVCGRLENNIEGLSSTLKAVESVLQKERLEIEETDITRFIIEEAKDRFESAALKVEVIPSRRKMSARVDRAAFRDVLGNLINNAIKHGFVEMDREPVIRFMISLGENDLGIPFVRIVYKNNGRPFPKGFEFCDYKLLGSRAGKNRGSGIGGFFVARTIELHGGEFNQIQDADDSGEFPVQFEILLPAE